MDNSRLIADLKADLSRAQSELLETSRYNAEMQITTKEAQNAATRLSSTNAQLQSHLVELSKSHEAEVGILRSNLSGEMSAHAAARVANSQLTTEVRTLTERLSASEKKCANLETVLVYTQSQRDVLQQRLQRVNDKFAALESFARKMALLGETHMDDLLRVEDEYRLKASGAAGTHPIVLAGDVAAVVGAMRGQFGSGLQEADQALQEVARLQQLEASAAAAAANNVNSPTHEVALAAAEAAGSSSALVVSSANNNNDGNQQGGDQQQQHQQSQRLQESQLRTSPIKGGAGTMTLASRGGGGSNLLSDQFEPIGNDPASLQEQVMRLRALVLDSQRAAAAAREDAASFERELLALRYRTMTGSQLYPGPMATSASSVGSLANTTINNTAAATVGSSASPRAYGVPTPVLRSPREVLAESRGGHGVSLSVSQILNGSRPYNHSMLATNGSAMTASSVGLFLGGSTGNALADDVLLAASSPRQQAGGLGYHLGQSSVFLHRSHASSVTAATTSGQPSGRGSPSPASSPGSKSRAQQENDDAFQQHLAVLEEQERVAREQKMVESLGMEALTRALAASSSSSAAAAALAAAAATE
jgi:hypothetical protein